MAKSFAQIESSLPHSKKLRKLNHKEKRAYLCAHLTPLSGYIGIYRYPLPVWLMTLTRHAVKWKPSLIAYKT